jgi:ParB family chromosome partitioning protein
MSAAARTQVPLSELSIDDTVNVRKTGRGSEPQFAASIRAKGVIEPLIVRKNGKGYTVTNGSKRFDALRFLKEKGDNAAGTPVTDAFQVPIIVRDEDDGEARETSLITNIVRSPTHPVDCYEQFAQLVKDGRTVADIAATYAMTPNAVDQTLALGALSPAVRQAWREDKIKPDAAQAFTMASSHKHQDAVLGQLLKKQGKFQYAYGGNIGHLVRSALVGDKQGDASRFVTFVGVAAYEAAGGKVIKDLFGGNHAVSDPALAKKMADEKLLATCADLMKAGWSWAKPDHEIKDQHRYGAINHNPKFEPAEKKRVAELNALIEKAEEDDDADEDQLDDMRDEVERITAEAEARAYTAAEKAKSGCAVEISRDGTKLKVTYGLTPPQNDRAPASQASGSRSASAAASKPKASVSKTLSGALKQRLDRQLDKATRAALKADKHPNALATVTAATIASMIDCDNNWSHTPQDVKKALPAIRDAITPAVMKAALLKEFDPDVYFKGAPANLRVKALDEMGCKARPSKAGDVIKLCIAEATKAKWLPGELRTSHYDGPGSKGKTAKAKKK